MTIRTLFAIVSLALAPFAFAPAAAAADAGKPSPHSCEKPGEHPGRLGSDANRRKWVNDANAYLECLKKYALDQQAIAKPLLEQAKPHADAANAAIDEYNKAVKSLKEESDKNS
jgi:hypothetical protein